jgi:hypothetical protein
MGKDRERIKRVRKKYCCVISVSLVFKH